VLEALGDPLVARCGATLRAFIARAGALTAIALLDRAGLPPVVVDVTADGPIEVLEGDDALVLGAEAFADAEPLAIPDIRPLPPMDVDAASGKVVGLPGALGHQAAAVRELASLLPGRSAVTVGFASSDPDVPVFIAAREGEPAVVSLGQEQFALDIRP
jgi:hypothetical protein